MSPSEPITDRVLEKNHFRKQPKGGPGFEKKGPWTHVTSLATILFAGLTLFNLSQPLFLGLTQIGLGLNQIASFFEGRNDITRGSSGKAALVVGSFCVLVGVWILGSAVWSSPWSARSA